MKRTAFIFVPCLVFFSAIAVCGQSFSCDWISSFDNIYEIDENLTPFLAAAAKLKISDLEPGQSAKSIEQWAAKRAEQGDQICWQVCGCGEIDPDSEAVIWSHICADLMIGTSEMDYFVISVKMAHEFRTFLKKPELYALYIKYHDEAEKVDTFSAFQKAIDKFHLQRATEKGYWKLVNELIDSGVDVNIKNKSGKTPLHLAVIYDRQQIVKGLVTEGADVKTRDEWDATPLHYALSPVIAEILISGGADIDSKMYGGDTPLYRSIYRGDPDVSSLLIHKGCDLKTRDSNGRTALHVATVSDQLEIAKLLIEKGIDVNYRDNYGKTAYKLALENNKKDVADLLISAGGKE